MSMERRYPFYRANLDAGHKTVFTSMYLLASLSLTYVCIGVKLIEAVFASRYYESTDHRSLVNFSTYFNVNSVYNLVKKYIMLIIVL